MNLQEAASVLGIQNTDTAVTIKRKYHTLLHRYHPDTGSGSASATRMIVEAYKILRDAPRLPVSSLPPANPVAYCERTLYARHNLFEDDPADIYVRGRGRFLWDPEQEEFSLFARSVLLEARRLCQEQPERLKIVFHLLMQDFINPLESLRKMCDDDKNDIYSMEGRLDRPLSGPVPCILTGTRIHAGDALVSFDDDAWYYIISMLLARNAAAAAAVPLMGGRISIQVQITDTGKASRTGNASSYLRM